MKQSFLIYPAVLLFSLGASLTASAAPGSGYEADPPVRWNSGITRVQVQRELVHARAAGQLDIYREGYDPVVATNSTLGRAEVRAAAIAARDAGFEEQFREGSSGGVHFAQRPHSDRSRVLAGLAR